MSLADLVVEQQTGGADEEGDSEHSHGEQIPLGPQGVSANGRGHDGRQTAQGTNEHQGRQLDVRKPHEVAQ